MKTCCGFNGLKILVFVFYKHTNRYIIECIKSKIMYYTDFVNKIESLISIQSLII